MRVAILGCGQLARMLAQAAGKLGVECAFVAIDGETTACVDGLGPVVSWSGWDDVAALFDRLGSPDHITVERESIDVELLRSLQGHCQVAPSPTCVRIGQNRRLERELLDRLAIPCAPHRVVTTAEQVRAAVRVLGLPLVVKATESGYDGKLQWRLRSPAEVDAFLRGFFPGELLLEQWVEFEREVSIVAARSAQGEFSAYPLTENLHRDGILLASIAPAREVPPALHQAAVDYARAIMEHLDYVGVMGIEFFVVDGAIWVNELAPRVHNSGHWTMQEGLVSQFENHLRAILGLPLGTTAVPGQPVGMINILGGAALDVLQAGEPGLQLHMYNKVPAPLRKLGHLNVVASTESELVRRLDELHRRLYRAHCAGLQWPGAEIMPSQRSGTA